MPFDLQPTMTGERVMLEQAFRFVRSVVFFVGPDNRRSQRALEKIGARREPEPDGRGRVVYRIARRGPDPIPTQGRLPVA